MKNAKKIEALKEESARLDRSMDRFRAANAVGGFNAIVKKQFSVDKKQAAIWAQIDKLKK
jgi:hypothetical protein